MRLSLKNEYVLCVDIGGTSTKAGMLNARGEISFSQSIPTEPDAEAYIAQLTGLIATTRQQALLGGQIVSELGVAIAGFLDEDRSYLTYNSNLAWLEKFPLRQRLTENFPDLSIEFEIDSNASTMAEYRFGSGQGSRRFLCLTAGTGLGVGMTVDGAPLRFAYGCMGDIGHTVVLRSGPLCTCGGRGCAEIMVSAPAIAERYRVAASIERPVSLRQVIEAAQTADPVAISVLKTAGEWLGVAIASMANTFFPDHIAVAGGLSTAGSLVLGPAERVFRESACVLARSSTTFAQARLGSQATLIGAAWPFWSSNPNNRPSVAPRPPAIT